MTREQRIAAIDAELTWLRESLAHNTDAGREYQRRIDAYEGERAVLAGAVQA